MTGTQNIAEQAMVQQCGVCRDYAHILLALLRIEKISYRYVSGVAFESGKRGIYIGNEQSVQTVFLRMAEI